MRTINQDLVALRNIAWAANKRAETQADRQASKLVYSVALMVLDKEKNIGLYLAERK
jgi:hypothetical protein